MTSHVGRLYATAIGLVALFLTSAAIAAHPWVKRAAASPQPDTRLAALAAREQRVQKETLWVKRVVAKRWAAYRSQLAAVRSASAAAPSVRVVTLPPLTVTRTS